MSLDQGLGDDQTEESSRDSDYKSCEAEERESLGKEAKKKDAKVHKGERLKETTGEGNVGESEGRIVGVEGQNISNF